MTTHGQAPVFQWKGMPMTTYTLHRALVLDDGEFYVELNENFAVDEAPGFLQRRCYVGVTTPGGYECVGSFAQDPRGRWQASVYAPYDPVTDSDSRSLGRHNSRMDAIVALWSARRQALCRHKSD